MKFFESIKELDEFIETLDWQWKIESIITRPYNELSHYVVVISKGGV